jgi:NTE family protein
MSTVTPGPTGTVGETQYRPDPPSRRRGVALCLSGGGFRASLFHLGALRRLNEFGVLGRIDTLSVVSGGAILAAHLSKALRAWPEPGEVAADWEARVAAPFRAFASRDIRTWPILKRVLPWNWFRSTTQVEAMVRTYNEFLTQGLLADLPARPEYVFCATDMVFGVNWVFQRSRVGDYQAGYADPPAGWSIARAAAASSCFPPVFGPMKCGLDPALLKKGSYRADEHPDRDRLVAAIRLTDGGCYDNMGLEPVWKGHATVLVSDGGAVFRSGPQEGVVGRVMRYPAIVDRQSRALRKRWLISSFDEKVMSGTYWGIGSAPSRYPAEHAPPPPGYSKRLALDVLSCIRTDLDAFSPAEAAVLENHGYLLADSAIRTHVPELAGGSANTAPVNIPHPEWMDEDRVRRELKDSHKRRKRGRGPFASLRV